MACATTPCNWKRHFILPGFFRTKFLLLLTTITLCCFLITTMVRNDGLRDAPSADDFFSIRDELRGEIKLWEEKNQERFDNLTNRISRLMAKLIREENINSEKSKTSALVHQSEEKTVMQSRNHPEHMQIHNKSVTTSLNLNQVTLTDQEHDRCQFLNHRLFPLCEDSLEKLKIVWNTSICYTNYHSINGSQCSLHRYLTNVEPYCMGVKEIYITPEPAPAIPRHQLSGLIELLPGKFYKWMRRRATFLWSNWVSNTKKLTTMRNKRKKVVVFLGGLNANSVLIEMADKGGPLGELVQWTDVITALYVLGYDLTVVRTTQELEAIVREGLNTEQGCARERYIGMPDVIYGDINSFMLFQNAFGEKALAKFRCTFRILDSFGTFVEYNYPMYPHKILGGRSPWADHNLLPTQIMTMFPHTQDNSYLGFVVSNNAQKYHVHYPSNRTKEKALLYAKDSRYLRFKTGIMRYLEIVNEYFDIHATCGIVDHLPSFIQNHGAVSREKIAQLLSEAKVFLGVGFPYEGPGPIEAMANGAVYLQPKFTTPVNKMNEKFFAGKPTRRKLTSQNPYMEEFIGEPYCYTIDVTDEKLLRTTLAKIKSMGRLPDKIPKDFSYEGMLERIHVYTQHMDYCNPFAPRWPPIQEHLKVHFGAVGESCKDICMSKGLLCERTFFNDVNTVGMIEMHTGGKKCSEVRKEIVLHAPSINDETGKCYLQQHRQIFSCMHSEVGFRRLCPCRDYEEGQSAICKNCL